MKEKDCVVKYGVETYIQEEFEADVNVVSFRSKPEGYKRQAKEKKIDDATILIVVGVLILTVIIAIVVIIISRNCGKNKKLSKVEFLTEQGRI